MPAKSWVADKSVCAVCDGIVIVTQPYSKDYFWYCADPDCVKHYGSETYDDEQPDWVKDVEPNEH